MDYSVIDRYIDRLMADTTPDKPIWNIENIKSGKKPGWNYIDGCMMTSLYSIYQQKNDGAYLDFIDGFVDYYVFADGSIRGYELETYNVDNINEGRILFDLYRETGKEKYRKAADLLYKQLLAQPRTGTGNFWHKKNLPQPGLARRAVYGAGILHALRNGVQRLQKLCRHSKAVQKRVRQYVRQKEEAVLPRLGLV